MKRLYVQYLMVASALALGASALDFCNTGNIGSPLDVAMTTPGSDNFVVDCTIGNMVALTLTGADGPTQPLAPITMRLQRSTLGVDSRVSIIGKAEYAESLANATAYKFIVEDNTFGQGAMLYVRGAFAPNTVITVARNVFSIADPLTTLFPDPPGRTDTMISAIYFHSLFLLNDVAVKVANNTIVGKNTVGKVAVNAIHFGADMYMYGDRASISVTDNDVEITCNATESHGTAIGGTKTLYVYGRDGRFAVERNVIRATGSSSVYRHPSIISAVAGSGVTSFTGNTVVANTTGMVAVDATTGFSPVIRLGSVTVNGNEVSAWINENTIDVTGPLASIGLDGEIQCGDNCAVYVADNRLSATGGNPSVFAQGRVDLRGTGALWVTGNELSRLDGAATAAPVTIAADLRMVGTSALAVTRNTFSADSPNKMVEFGAAGKFNPAPSATASVFLCGNSFGGNVLADSGAISAVVSTDIANKATFDDCPATTTTTLPPTTTTTSATDEEATSSNTTDVSGSTTQPGATTTVSGTTTGAVGATTTSSPVATTTDPNWSNKGTAAASLVGAIVAAAASIVVSLL